MSVDTFNRVEKGRSALRTTLNHVNGVSRHSLAVTIVFLLYIGIRLFYLSNVSILEDHDSTGYLAHVETFGTFDIQQIGDLGADTTPLYPFLVAVIDIPIGNPETSARLCSLFFSALLFLSLFLLGRKLAPMAGVLAGLFLLALSPVLIRLSYSVLTEPTYIGLVYFGLWLFFSQFKTPSQLKAILLGVVFGLGFLCRVEGILFVAFVPLLQGVHYLWTRAEHYTIKRLGTWTATYVIAFASLAAPQIVHVSSKMNSPALNGRQVWSAILNAQDGKSYEEKLYGLDYSPSAINLTVLQNDPDALRDLKRESSGASTLSPRTVAANFHHLYTQQIGFLLGPLVFALFMVGVFYLFRYGRTFEAVFALAFLALALVGPLLHNVVLRHIAVIAPLMLLFAGIGARFSAQAVADIRERFSGNRPRGGVTLLTAAVVGLTIVPWAGGLYDNYTEENNRSHAYRVEDLDGVVPEIRSVAVDHVDGVLVIATRRGFVIQHARSKGLEVEGVALPHTDYEGLVDYMHLNDVDLLYLEDRSAELERPFFEVFRHAEDLDEFELLYRTARGVQLWRFTGRDSLARD